MLHRDEGTLQSLIVLSLSTYHVDWKVALAYIQHIMMMAVHVNRGKVAVPNFFTCVLLDLG